MGYVILLSHFLTFGATVAKDSDTVQATNACLMPAF